MGWATCRKSPPSYTGGLIHRGFGRLSVGPFADPAVCGCDACGRRYLATLDPSLPWYLGRKFHLLGRGGMQYTSGGAGYVLSRGALDRIARVLPRCAAPLQGDAVCAARGARKRGARPSEHPR